jgi:hypothetical protein
MVSPMTGGGSSMTLFHEGSGGTSPSSAAHAEQRPPASQVALVLLTGLGVLAAAMLTLGWVALLASVAISLVRG